MWKFSHEEIIDAQPEVVFELISDLPNYQNWNPFVISASGPSELGGVISGKAVLGRFTSSYRHKIFEYVPNAALCWRDFGFLSLLFCGQRCRYLEARGDKTHFKCELEITGLLSGLVNLIFGNALRGGVVAEAKAIMSECEKIVALWQR